MKKVFAIAMCIGLASQLFAAQKGGFYPVCNGIKWASAPTGNYYGKSCIHCRDGSEVRLLVLYNKHGGQNYYRLDRTQIVNGGEGIDAINAVCR